MAGEHKGVDLLSEIREYEARRLKLDAKIADFNERWTAATVIPAEARTEMSSLVQENNELTQWNDALLHKSQGVWVKMDQETWASLPPNFQ